MPTAPSPTRGGSSGAPRTREAWKRLTPEERRAQLIAVAEELFVSRPYEEIGIADVARAAGITHGLIYHYFESKEALFTAAFEARTAELLARSLPDVSLPLPQQVELGVRGYLDFVEAHRISYLNLFRGLASTQDNFFRICEDARRAIIEHFLEVLGISRLTLPATRLSLRGYVGYVENAVLDWLQDPRVPRATLERLIFAAVGTALRAGLEQDHEELGDFPLREIFEVYDAHFGLR